MKNIECDKNISCMDSQTCCKISDGNFSCCPSKDAVCCSDGTSCCPKGYECVDKACEAGKRSLPAFFAVPALK